MDTLRCAYLTLNERDEYEQLCSSPPVAGRRLCEHHAGVTAEQQRAHARGSYAMLCQSGADVRADWCDTCKHWEAHILKDNRLECAVCHAIKVFDEDLEVLSSDHVV